MAPDKDSPLSGNSYAVDLDDVPVGLGKDYKRQERGVMSREKCWLDPEDEASILFRPQTCCFRAMVSVSAVIVGFPKAATTTMLRLLGTHPQIVADMKENGALADGAARVLTAEEVLAYNFGIQQLRFTKEGSQVAVVKAPFVVYNQMSMHQLAQIPGVKFIVMLREPTRWLLSIYNDFVQDCSRNETGNQLCCKRLGKSPDPNDPNRACLEKFAPSEIPRFWEHVVARRSNFSLSNLNVGHGMFSWMIKTTINAVANPDDVLFFDSGLFREGHETAYKAMQVVAEFLGVSWWNEVALKNALGRERRSKGGHTQARIAKVGRRARMCGGRSERRADLRANVYAQERRDLWNILVHMEESGSAVLTSSELFSLPCAVRLPRA